jgi:pimeloyl-ACP methyl ester carboxylesterase
MKKVFRIALPLLLAAACFGADRAVVCERYEAIPVTLAGSTAHYTVSGQLCATQHELETGATVQLLVHGATYSHDYWDFREIDGVDYSYARDVAANGIATFAFDQLGSGKSSHPPSRDLTLDAAADVAHQIVTALRNGSINGTCFRKVIIVGHSLGSVVVWQEAITYGDVDGVIVTGAAHSLTARFANAGAFYPAISDPKFARRGLDAGYLTTKPGTRTNLFFADPDFDPAIIPIDEHRKDTVPGSLLVTGLPLVTSTATQAIQVPVLILLGDHDFTTCGPNTEGGSFDCSTGKIVAQQEQAFYSAEARVHACVIPGSGHDINLAVNHDIQVADVLAWSSAFIGDGVRERNDSDDVNFDKANRGLPWNDRLPWNCGSAEPK